MDNKNQDNEVYYITDKNIFRVNGVQKTEICPTWSIGSRRKSVTALRVKGRLRPVLKANVKKKNKTNFQ